MSFTRQLARTARSASTIVALGASLALAAPTTMALAADGPDATTQPTSVAQDLARAVEDQDATSPVPGDVSALDSSGDGQLALGDDAPGSSSVTLALPVDSAVGTSNGTAVYDGSGAANEIAVQAIAGGVRAAIHIDGSAAPESYDFQVGGDAAQLTLTEDGTIAIADAGDAPLGTIAAPWARDADGTPVPTHYEIHGLTVTQVVEHRDGTFSYGITADPAVVTWSHAGWRFNRAHSKKVLEYLVTGTTAAIGGVVCFAFTEVPAIVFGCGAIIAKIADEIGKAVAKRALSHPNDCLEAGASFFPPHPYAKITGC